MNFSIPVVLMEHGEYSREQKIDWFKNREKELTEGIELVDGVTVRRMSKEDAEDINRYAWTLPEKTGMSHVRFVLAKNVSAEDHGFGLTGTMHRIVLGLRLLKKGYVSGKYVFYVSLSDESRVVDWARDEAQRTEFYGWGYAFSFDEIPALRNLLEKLKLCELDRNRRLGLACRRFQRAYEEDDFEDQLIDLMIALEALFAHKEAEGKSSKQKIAIGCSGLLGKDEDERRSIREKLTEAYTVRSRLVHGAEYDSLVEKSQSHDGNLYDFMGKLVEDVEGFVRDSIKMIINR